MPQTSRPEVPGAKEQSGTPLTKTQITRAAYWVKNKERLVAYRKKYHQEHREEILEKVRNHYHANRDKRLAYGKKWREANRDKMQLYKTKSDLQLRNDVFNHYGDGGCACCGETNHGFLTIDHINGGGNEHRRSINSTGGKDFYRWLRINQYPEGYQVLCFNCNLGKHRLGICPHQMPESMVSPL